MTYRITSIILSFFLSLQAWGDTATSVHTWADSSALAHGTWVKVALNETYDGIYQISYAQLRSWGFSDPSQVGVYGYGGHTLSESLANGHIDDVPEVATLHDEQGQRILFYGRGTVEWSYKNTTLRFVQRQHPCATYSCYFLHEKEGGEKPSAIETRASNTESQPADTLTDYDEYWLHEEELANLGQTGRQWYGESFVGSQAKRFILPEEAPQMGHALKAGSALLTVGFVTKTPTATSITVSVNGATTGTQTIGATTGEYTFGTEATMNKTLADSIPLTGAQVEIVHKAEAASTTTARLNYIRLQGKCELEASDKEAFMLFRNAAAINRLVAYRIAGLKERMEVWDVTSANEVFRQGLSADGAAFVPEAKGLREYAVVNLASKSFPMVSRIGTLANQDLHGKQAANLVIVTAPGLVQEALTLANHRNKHDGLSYLVVTPEAIYNEYSSGVPDVTAIRLFLKHQYDKEVDSLGQHTLRYLLLMGDGTYDNRTACKSSYLLPTYQSEASLVETSSCVCDDYFGFLDDNEGGRTGGDGLYILSADKLDIGIGRLPVSSNEEAANVVAKIISYDSDQYGSWKNRLCFLADDDKMESSATDSPNLHMRHNDQLVKQLQDDGHLEFLYQKIYLPAYQQTTSASGTDYPDARKELNNALQQGLLLLNYAGHGSTNNITHEQIMSASLASKLRMKHLPLWITASCDGSRFDADDASMGENLMLNAQGGAAALISTTRVVYASQNLKLNKAVIAHLFDRHSDGTRFRLGDILRVAKVSLANDYNKLNYCLIGDPSMTLAVPEQRAVVDSVKGEFRALETVTICGHVCQRGTSAIDTGFNGLIYPTIYDAEDTITADKGLYQEPIYNFTKRTRKVFAGRDIVRDGRFEFSFMIPQDISYSTGSGLVNLYACSDEGNEANGYYDDFVLGRGTAAADADTIGPEIIACFLEDPTFQSGDVVGATPYFYAEVADASGINATGNSIGHDVSLTLECLSNPLVASRQIVLNDQFTTFTATPTHGNVKYSLTDLAEGTYRATFRVWDVYNNTSARTFTFTTSSETKPAIALLQAFPSPVKQGGTVTFRALHNRPESADQLRLQVYTQTGVKVLDQTATTSAGEVVYLSANASAITDLNSALNADETSQLMGCTTMTWTADVAPGVYLYRAYLTAGGNETATQSKMLIVY